MESTYKWPEENVTPEELKAFEQFKQTNKKDIKKILSELK